MGASLLIIVARLVNIQQTGSNYLDLPQKIESIAFYLIFDYNYLK